MHTGSFVDWLTLLVLSMNARLIWHRKETNKIRIANEAQLEAQIRPAIAVRFSSLQELELVNLGRDRHFKSGYPPSNEVQRGSATSILWPMTLS